MKMNNKTLKWLWGHWWPSKSLVKPSAITRRYGPAVFVTAIKDGT